MTYARHNAALVERYAELVQRIARHVKRRCPPHVSLGDLIQAGYVGLLEAARAYADGSPRKTPFDEAVGLYIRSAIFDALKEMSSYRHTERARRDRGLLALERKHEQGPSHDALAEKLDYANHLVTVALLEMAAQATPESDAIAKDVRQRVRAALAHLPHRERALLQAHFFDHREFQDIGPEIGLRDKSELSRLRASALARLAPLLADLRSAVNYTGGQL